jgi:hypothetical protein
LRRLLLLLVVVAALSAPGVARADAPWNCDPGICRWGYNYVTPTVNDYVPSPYNYWTFQYIDKWNGGWVGIGFMNVYNICDWQLNGVTYGTFYSDDATCGNYCHSWVDYISGNQSYLFTYVYV